jgi:hypothetical protein
MIVARRFIAGVRDHMACVPEGRLQFGHFETVKPGEI